MAKDKYARSKDRAKGNAGFAILDTSEYPDIEYLKYSKDATYSLDIIPYKIATKNHPEVASGDADIGDEDYILDVRVHRGIGPKKANFICPRSFDKKCPVCDYLDSIKQQYGYNSSEYTKVKNLATQHKAIYLVVDPDDDDQKVKLFDTSFANFQKELLDQATADGAADGLDIIPFAEWPKGCTVTFRVSMVTVKANGGSYQYPEFKSFKFKQRKGNEYPDDFLDNIPALDELMIIKTAAEIEAMLSPSDEGDEDEPEERPSKTRASQREEEEEDEDEEEEEEVSTKCPVKGGTFGVDVDDLPECDSCKLRSECSAAYRANRRK